MKKLTFSYPRHEDKTTGIHLGGRGVVVVVVVVVEGGGVVTGFVLSSNSCGKGKHTTFVKEWDSDGEITKKPLSCLMCLLPFL